MIAFPDRLPLLRVGAYDVYDYNAFWIEKSIREAAQQAGHQDWWLAKDIARSLLVYLQERFQKSAITLKEMVEKVRLMLGAVGFREIADKLVKLCPPPYRISLEQLSREAGESYELGFFQLLENRIRECGSLQMADVRISGLRPAVKSLCRAAKWRQDCERLQGEVVCFARQRMAEAGIQEFSLQ